MKSNSVYCTAILIIAAAVACTTGCSNTPPDISARQLRSKSEGHVIALCFSADGKHLFSAESFRWKSNADSGSDPDGVVSRWDLASGDITSTEPFRFPTALAASVDGDLLAVGTANWSAPRPGETPRGAPAYRNVGSVHLLDATTLGTIGSVSLEQGVVGVAFIPKTDYLAAYCIDSENTPSVSLIDVKSQVKVASKTLSGQPLAIEHRGAVRPLVYSELDGGSLVVLNPSKGGNPGQGTDTVDDDKMTDRKPKGTDGELLLLSVPSLSVIRSVQLEGGDETFLDISSDGKSFAVVAHESCIIGRFGVSNENASKLQKYGAYVSAAFILPGSGQILAFEHKAIQRDAPSIAGAIVEVRAEKSSTVAVLTPQENRMVFSAAISNDRQKAASAGNDGVIQLWSLNDDESARKNESKY